MKYLIIQVLIIILALLAGCESPSDMNRPGDRLSGYITHFDTNVIITSSGFYSVSVFSADSVVPFNKIPVRTDSLRLTRRPDLIVYESTYQMDGIPPGSYYVAATWSRYPRVPNEIPMLLGTYGCDTSYTCTNHIVVVYPNFDGNFRNILCWSDTLRKMN
jgi:hypothetical protein